MVASDSAWREIEIEMSDMTALVVASNEGEY
jgi:hypothetical protein